MSNTTSISIQDLSKKYRIGAVKSDNLIGTINQLLRQSFKREKETVEKEFWALKDINLDIGRGEAVGIIGKNGAGKSTLLKVLSRITEPTTGNITIDGRVSSLLEVGTGFHPELSGRENIFLNGTILGMSRREIRSRFDDIVEFSGVGKFINTAVKHYSSGMYVRLAFSVAAHLEPEILIIDEVLAVGDAEFQKKCLGKMEDVTKQGRTVLFVSHNMNAVESLCNRCILIKDGQVAADSTVMRDVIDQYLHGGSGTNVFAWENQGSDFLNEYHSVMKLHAVSSSNKLISSSVPKNEPVSIITEGEIIQENDLLNMGIAVYDTANNLILTSFVKDMPQDAWPKLSEGTFKLSCTLPPHALNEGVYRVEFISGLHYQKWFIEPGHGGPAINLEIRGGLSDSPFWIHKRSGILAPILEWAHKD